MIRLQLSALVLVLGACSPSSSAPPASASPAGGAAGTGGAPDTGGAAGASGAAGATSAGGQACSLDVVTMLLGGAPPKVSCPVAATATPGFYGYSPDAAPSGGCGMVDVPCSIGIAGDCCGQPAKADGWACVCADGSWCCANVSPSATICPGCP